MPSLTSYTDEASRLGISRVQFLTAPAGAFQNAGYNEAFKRIVLAGLDVVAPAFANWTPPGAIDLDDVLQVDVTDARGILTTHIYVTFEDGHVELAYSHDAFTAGYDASSSVSTITNGYRYFIARDEGWYGAITATIETFDTSGNRAQGAAGYTAPPPEPPDTGPPTIANLVPAPNSQLQPADPIAFDVQDETLLLSVMILARFSFLDAPELVHDGLAFSPAYSANSTREVIDGGWHYTLLRKAGWPEGPTLLLYVLDAAGNEGTEAVD